MICPVTKEGISEEYKARYCSHTGSSCKFCDLIKKQKSTNQNPKCKNCGHHLRHHHTMGGITLCQALISRVPHKFCDCKKFEEAQNVEKT